MEPNCSACGKQIAAGQAIPLSTLRPSLQDRLKRHLTGPPESAAVCAACRDLARAEEIRDMINRETGELSILETEVLEALKRHSTFSHDPEAELDKNVTLGQRLADRVATFGGSWAFIGLFGVIILVWMATNGFILQNRAFDPYPFILLNLVLSCLAALQAPVIMMSQNRQEAKDRLRSQHDYQVNLKAELEVRLLHEKLDHLLLHQMRDLMEVQQVQLDMLTELQQR